MKGHNLSLTLRLYTMLNSLINLCQLGIVKPIKRPNQIPCNPTHPLKRHMLESRPNLHVIAIHIQIQRIQWRISLVLPPVDVRLNLAII
jgi:hypothetical protein